jgi:hypothetical protein
VSIIYEEFPGFDYKHSIKYACFIDPGMSIQLLKYCDGNLLYSREFLIDDIADAGYPPQSNLLPPDVKNKVLSYEGKVSDDFWYGRILGISKKTVTMSYMNFDFPQKRKLSLHDFTWRNVQ